MVLPRFNIIHTIRLYIFNFQSGKCFVPIQNYKNWKNSKFLLHLDLDNRYPNGCVVLILCLILFFLWINFVAGFFRFISNSACWKSFTHIKISKAFIIGEATSTITFSALCFSMGRSLCKYNKSFHHFSCSDVLFTVTLL